MYEELVTEAERMSPNSRFHSVRTLMRRYAVSQRTVEHVLNRMTSDQLIVKIPKDGLFVKGSRNKDVKNLILLVPSWRGFAYSERIQALEKYCAENGRYNFFCQHFNVTENIFSKLPIIHADVIVVCPAGGFISVQDIAFIAAAPVPVIVFGKEVGDLNISSVNGNGAEAGALAAATLVRNGHEKMAILLSEPDCEDQQDRMNGFCNFLRMIGKEAKIIDCDTKNGEFSDDKANEVLSRYLDNNGLDFTGLFVISDGSVPGAYNALKNKGYRIPDDVSVIGHDGLNAGKFYDPPLTTINTSPEKMVQGMMERIDTLFADSPLSFFHFHAVPELLWRDSVSDISLSNNIQIEERI